MIHFISADQGRVRRKSGLVSFHDFRKCPFLDIVSVSFPGLKRQKISSIPSGLRKLDREKKRALIFESSIPLDNHKI
jgi:hypothetical protein